MIRRLESAQFRRPDQPEVLSPAFVLDTEGTTYAFRILPTGQPEHLYYGRRIPLQDPAAFVPLTEYHTFPPGNAVVYDPDHPQLSLEEMGLEVSAPGKGDVREPCLEITHADGSRTVDFTFVDAEITPELPPTEGLPGSYGEGGEHLAVTLVEKHYGLILELHYQVWPDCDCICRWARLLNRGEEAVTVERLLSLQLDLPGDRWAVTSFHGAWGREMDRHTLLPLTAGKFVSESRCGTSSSRSNPFFMVHAPDATEESGAVYGFNLLYSGNHYECAEVHSFGKTRVLTGIHPQGFSWTLAPGESLRSPEAVMTFSPAGFTGQSVNMHAFVREHIVRGEWKGKPRPVLLNSWEASYFKITEQSLLSLARAAKEVGVELFVMDDGWFGERSDDTRALGDWDPNPRKLPGGLKGLGERINDLGLSFGLWVEPEMVNVNSRLYESHPDWVTQIPGRPHSEGRNQRILDLCNPDVQDFLIEKMTGVFSSANIAYVKWDMNRVFSDVYAPSLPPERQGEAHHRYVLGLYRVMGVLTQRFPHILFEGCAAGGNRFDLGILSFFPQIWASDNTDAMSRSVIQAGYSYGYPQSVIGAHVSASPNHQTLRETSLATRFHVAAFGLLGYELDLRDLSGEEKKEIREQIETYKRWREVLQFGQLYRGGGDGVCQWTCVAPDRSRAVGLLFQPLAQVNRPAQRFTPKGLDPDRVYRFYNQPREVDVRQFGSLINTMAPFHVKQGSLVHDAIARVVKMPGELEEVTAPGAVLLYAGIALKPAFGGTGFNGDTRLFPDFASRMYFLETSENQED